MRRYVVWLWMGLLVAVLPVLGISCGNRDAGSGKGVSAHGELYALVDSMLAVVEDESEQVEWRAADGGSGVNDDTADRARRLQNLLKNNADGNVMLWLRYFTTEGEEARQGLRNEIEECLKELQPDGVWMGHLGYVGALLAMEAGDEGRAAELAGDAVLSLGGHVRVYAPALKMLADFASKEGDSASAKRLMMF